MGVFKSCIRKLIEIGILLPDKVMQIMKNAVNLYTLSLQTGHPIKENFFKCI